MSGRQPTEGLKQKDLIVRAELGRLASALQEAVVVDAFSRQKWSAGASSEMIIKTRLCDRCPANGTSRACNPTG